ncbi:hypothetical protein RKD48_004417 [Streptomyces ambofaciens]
METPSIATSLRAMSEALLVAVRGHAALAHQPVPVVVAADDGEAAGAVVVGLQAGDLTGQQGVALALAVGDRRDDDLGAELHVQVAEELVVGVAEGEPERRGHVDALVDPSVGEHRGDGVGQRGATDLHLDDAGEGGTHHQ